MLNNVPYVSPGTLIAIVIAVLGALWVGRPSWIIPAAVFWGAAGVFVGWRVLRRYGLSISATVGDVAAAQAKEKERQ